MQRCLVGDGVCLCQAYSSHSLPALVDVTSQCRNFYSCNSNQYGSYKSCPSGYLYSEQSKKCLDRTARMCTSALYPSPNTGEVTSSANWKSRVELQTLEKYGYVVYYESWAEKYTENPFETHLANLPPYITFVMISFMKPDTTYTSGVTFEGTGLGFSSPPQVIKDAIQLLKEKNPDTKVYISVGGATYTNFVQMNTEGILQFALEFGLDGIDLDFEPVAPGCRANLYGVISCESDEVYIQTVRMLRAAMPLELDLSAAVWNVGAYGEGAYANSQPQGGYTGVSINMLRSVGNSSISWIGIMAYDAGTSYNPKEAFDAYSQLYSGPIYLGMQVAPESWGGHVLSMPEVTDLSMYSKSHGGAGMMLWALQKRALEGPDATQISQRVCEVFHLQDCSAPLFPLSPLPPPSPRSPDAPSDPPPVPLPSPSSPPLSPTSSPASPSPVPPTPPPLICQYKGSYSIKTVGCKINTYLSYSRTQCADLDVRLLKYSQLASRDLKQTYWRLPSGKHRTSQKFSLEAVRVFELPSIFNFVF